MALYQKHRPPTLEGVKGNKNVITTLKSMIKKKTIPHALLFVGPTGCGKTTLARIVANELGCTANNLIEIDTAQFNGIDSVRDIRKSAQYVPLGGGVRIFINDEIHRMTVDAQNAFLKILEDTPPHVYFILCTTNEKSLLPTIIGRCSRFQVSPLADDEMVELIEEVSQKEGHNLDEEVVRAVVTSANGHSRNALTILEQVLATPPKKRLAIAQQAQELETESIELCRALLSCKGWQAVSKILKNLKQADEPETVRRVVLGYMTSVLLNKFDEQAALVLECFEEPLYNTGFPGLVLACAKVVKG